MKKRWSQSVVVVVFGVALAATSMLWAPAGGRADRPDDAAEERARSQAEWETRQGYMYYVVPDGAPPKRDLPNYDGREGSPKTAGQVFLWFPRTIFFPVYLVSEFVIRDGIGAAITKAEEKEVPARVRDAFTFGPDDQYTMFPVFSFDLGFRPTVGVAARFGRVPTKDTAVTFNGNFGGIDFVSGSAGIQWTPEGKNWQGGISGGAARFADGLFFGLGSEASSDNRSRYSVTAYDAALNYNVQPWRRGGMNLGTGYKLRSFGNDVSGTTIPERLLEGGISELPPAFPEGYSAWFLDWRITFDSRRPRPQPGSGVRIDSGFNLGVDPVRGDTSDSWIIYGAAVRGFLDVSGHNHTFSLGAIVLLSDAFRGEVPFTELPTVSGGGPMPGFVGRFLSGDSASVLNFQFTWPIWIQLDGKIHFAVGNVFDGHLSNFAFDDLRMSFGAGIQAHGAESTGFELMVGGGTETFAQGASVTTVRFVLGASRDF
ncbi:MAG: hypothetical protein AAF500_02850 [Myxococcota bacterium]